MNPEQLPGIERDHLAIGADELDGDHRRVRGALLAEGAVVGVVARLAGMVVGGDLLKDERRLVLEERFHPLRPDPPGDDDRLRPLGGILGEKRLFGGRRREGIDRLLREDEFRPDGGGIGLRAGHLSCRPDGGGHQSPDDDSSTVHETTHEKVLPDSPATAT